jgi:hypothetical protein
MRVVETRHKNIIIADRLSGVKYSVKAAALCYLVSKKQIITTQVPVGGFQGSTFKGSEVR